MTAVSEPVCRDMDSEAASQSSQSEMTICSEYVLRAALGDADLVARIKASNVLVVGAGGIGCEVLKGLLLAGFPRITIIDLDTIDVSNLNRQFLYNKSHVGQSKARVAAVVSVERFAHHEPHGQPCSEVVPIHDSVLSPSYDREFYRQFTLVINALDNNATRVHVNRMCLAADLPLIESGSAGYLGNVTLIKGGVTRCFECSPPKKDEKSYASCTIRSTPSLPIHCIVWAKHLFAQLFGQSDEDISPDPTALPAEDQNGQASSSSSQTTRQYVESIDYDPAGLFDKIFRDDIVYLQQMKALWEKRRMPRTVSFDAARTGQIRFDDEDNQTDHAQTNGSVATAAPILDEQRLWTMQQCADVLVRSLAELKERLKLGPGHCLEWDKDDDTAMDFVTAVSNFRCYCFHIERKSRFEAKSLAGNIIPAISSTNTVVGGFILLQAIRLLPCLRPQRMVPLDKRSQVPKPIPKELKQEAERLLANGFTVYVTNENRSGARKVAIESLAGPNPECMACSGKIKEIVVQLPFDRTTLADLIKRVVIGKFKTVAPDINCYDLKKLIYAAEDEPELKDPSSLYQTKTLAMLDYFNDGIRLNVKDLEQDFEVVLRLQNVLFSDDDQKANDGDLFRVMNQDELDSVHREQQEQQQPPSAPAKKRKLSSDEAIAVDDDEDVVECLETGSKRVRTN